MTQPPTEAGPPRKPVARGSVHPLGQVVMLWGVPGTGKSTFARWLCSEKSYEHVDTDALALHGVQTELQRSWATVGRPGGVMTFMKAAAAQPSAVVVEYGMYANGSGLQLLDQLRQSGAEPWWFDGDREAAREAWRGENRKAGRPFEDGAWEVVVGVIDVNWSHVERFFGERIVRTIESGGRHVLPAETYRMMLDIMERAVG